MFRFKGMIDRRHFVAHYKYSTLLIRNSRDTIFKDLNCTDDLNHVHVAS